jgi:Tfp pilus assembly protein PilF
MKTRSFTILSLSLAALITLSACSSTSSAVAEQDPRVETKAQAIAIALDYLRQQSYAEEYLADTAEAEETKLGWQVMVKHVDWKERRPSVGLMWVSKATGEVSWLPLR